MLKIWVNEHGEQPSALEYFYLESHKCFPEDFSEEGKMYVRLEIPSYHCFLEIPY